MITIILNHQPYNGSDVTWNALRLASKFPRGKYIFNE